MHDDAPPRRLVVASLVALVSGLLTWAVASVIVHTHAFNATLVNLGVFPAPLRLPFVVICTLGVAAGATRAFLWCAHRAPPPPTIGRPMVPGRDDLWPY